MGRWISEDPIGFLAGDSNTARFVGNNPTNFADPSGLVSDPDQPNWHHLWEQGERLLKDPELEPYADDIQRAVKDYLGPDGVHAKENGWLLFGFDHDDLHNDGAWLDGLIDRFKEHFKNNDGITSDEVGNILLDNLRSFPAFDQGVPAEESYKEWQSKRSRAHRRDVMEAAEAILENQGKHLDDLSDAAKRSLLKNLGRRGKAALPACIGIFLTLWFLPEEIEAKGFGRAMVNLALDEIPILEWIKPGIEIGGNVDLVPDKDKPWWHGLAELFRPRTEEEQKAWEEEQLRLNKFRNWHAK